MVHLLLLDSRLLEPSPLVLILLLKADLIIQGARNEVRSHFVRGHAWLTCLPIQKVIRGASESSLLTLVAWSIVRMLEVNKCIAEVGLCTKSCGFFQRIFMTWFVTPLDIRDCFHEFILFFQYLLVLIFRGLQVRQVAVLLWHGH